MSFPDPIPGIIPFGTLTIFAGAPAVGKTTMLVDWMRRWKDGRPIWGHPTHPPPGGFYYVAADRGQTAEQFHAKVGFSEDVHFYSVVSADSGIDHTNFHKDAHGAQLLTSTIVAMNPQPGSHLFIDPLAPLFITGNQNRSRDVAASLVGLSRIIEERQINITGVCHFAKQKANKNDRYTRPQDRISGSGAFSGFSDTQIFLVDPEPPHQPYYVLGWNPRHHKPEEFKCIRDEWFEPYVGPDMVGMEDTDGEIITVSVAMQIFGLILQAGKTGIPSPVLCSQCRAQFSLSKATFYRIIAKLKAEGKVDVTDTGVIKAKPG